MLRFRPRFGPGGPGTLKLNGFCKTSSKFCDFAFISSSRLRDPIWDPPGLRFGSLQAVKMPPRPPQGRTRHAQEHPRGLQDNSKSAREASQTTPRSLQDRSKRPSGGQEAPRGLWGAIWDPFGLHFGQHLDVKTISRRSSDGSPQQLPT